MRWLILAVLVVCCGMGVAGEVPHYWVGIKTLTVEEAKGFAKLSGPLHLEGLTTLTPEVAKALTQKQIPTGVLFLDGLVTLSPDVAKELAKFNGPVSLNGLATLSPDVAKELAKLNEPVWLDGLATLSVEASKALALHNGALRLNGLTTLSPEVATELAKLKGSLSLNGLVSLTPEVAGALAKHEGGVTRDEKWLRLDGLTTLSDEAAEAIAKHKGTLWLEGLTTLSDRSAAALRKKQAEERPRWAIRSLQVSPKIEKRLTQLPETAAAGGVRPSTEIKPDRHPSFNSSQATVSQLPEAEFQAGRQWFRSKSQPYPADPTEIQASATSFVDYILTRPDASRYQKPLDHLAYALEPLVKANKRQELAAAVGATPKEYFLIYKELLDNCRWGERPAIDVNIPMSQSQLVSHCVDAYADLGKLAATPAGLPAMQASPSGVPVSDAAAGSTPQNINPQAVPASISDVVDSPEDYVGKSARVSVWLLSDRMLPHKEVRLSSGEVLFNGFVCQAADGNADPNKELLGSLVFTPGQAAIVFEKKDFGRGVLRALKAGQWWKFDAIVDVKEIRNGYDKKCFVIAIEQLEFESLVSGKRQTLTASGFAK